MKRRLVRVLAVACAATLLGGAVAGCGNSTDSGGDGNAASSADGETAEVGGEVAVDEWNIPVLSAVTGAIAYVGAPASWAAQYAVDQNRCHCNRRFFLLCNNGRPDGGGKFQ